MRRLGTVLIVVGLGILAWVVTVSVWKDPFTTLYTAYEQRELESSLERRFETFVAPRPSPRRSPSRRQDDLSRAARRFRLATEDGDAIGRLRIPRLDLDVVVVDGTSPDDLRRGPGRHRDTAMPGEGELVYIAGHRTTYGAPFSAIDELARGDAVSLELPYGTIEYRVTAHRIVDDEDLSVLESRGREELVLQACHPRFFASQRYLVYARPVAVRARG
ncbi:MAG: class E sortase [Thermoleophilia bacterium]|nr:class E sortase [Thermoleophilia bacterium]